MDKPPDQKARLRQVTVEGLFGRYSHDFRLAESDRVTILHGPNGVGKTAMLRLLFAIFSGRPFQALSTKFRRLTLRFEGLETFEITRLLTDSSQKSEKITIRAIDQLGLETTHELDVDEKLLTRTSETISRRSPWLRRVDAETWFDRRTGEHLSYGELFARIEANDAGLTKLKPFSEVLQMFRAIAARVDVHIIETQRLLSKAKRSRPSPSYRYEEEGDSDVRTTVSECAIELKQRIAGSLSQYATESQKRDQTFPMRLLALAQFGQVDPDQLKKKLRDIGEKRRQLAEIGLLVNKTDTYAESFERLDLQSADDAQRRVIELYAGDTAGKLQTLDEVLEVARLFIGVVNRRFRHKRIVLDREHGLIATSDLQDTISLDALSSGEQHQLVLFFDLLFRVHDGSLVLIDEPELSLHVSWQKSFMSSLLEIAASKSLEVLVATHSPYIVADRVDLMRELGSPDEPRNAEF